MIRDDTYRIAHRQDETYRPFCNAVDMSEPFERLRAAREKAGYGTPTEAATAFGWNDVTYRSHENGTRGLKPSVADRYAKAFRVKAGWLLTGEGQEPASTPPPSTSQQVPILDWVSAGRLRPSAPIMGIDDLPQISVSDLADGDWVALQVEGDSMDRISPPESIIVVNRRETRLHPNACYVIQTDDGATYKRWRPNPDRFEPVSTNPANEAIFPTGPVRIIGRVRLSMIKM